MQQRQKMAADGIIVGVELDGGPDFAKLTTHFGGYGHTVEKSLAMALVAPEAAEIGSELSVHIVGAERKARIIEPSPYDPLGKTMRA